jgi:hypothetical protein
VNGEHPAEHPAALTEGGGGGRSCHQLGAVEYSDGFDKFS